MDESEETAELITFLQRRSQILTCLQDDPREKQELVEELDIARSTLDRAMRELESANVVTYTDGKYALTSIGEYLVREFFAFVERAELTVELEPFLQWASPEAFDLDIRWLADAELWTPQSNDPYAMVNQHVRAIQEADHVRGMAPLIGLHAMEMVHERVIEDGARQRVVVEPGVVETLKSDESYASLYRDLKSRDAYSCSVYEGTIPFFVGIFDDELVQIGVDEEREPRALLETDREEVREWAHKTIDAYEQEAVEMSDYNNN